MILRMIYMYLSAPVFGQSWPWPASHQERGRVRCGWPRVKGTYLAYTGARQWKLADNATSDDLAPWLRQRECYLGVGIRGLKELFSQWRLHLENWYLGVVIRVLKVIFPVCCYSARMASYSGKQGIEKVIFPVCSNYYFHLLVEELNSADFPAVQLQGQQNGWVKPYCRSLAEVREGCTQGMLVSGRGKKEHIDCFLCRFQQLRSYHTEIETRTVKKFLSTILSIVEAP